MRRTQIEAALCWALKIGVLTTCVTIIIYQFVQMGTEFCNMKICHKCSPWKCVNYLLFNSHQNYYRVAKWTIRLFNKYVIFGWMLFRQSKFPEFDFFFITVFMKTKRVRDQCDKYLRPSANLQINSNL